MRKLIVIALVACLAGSIAAAPAAQAKKKKKKPVACAAYTPGELGADKPIVTLTDANTEAAPLEQKVTLGESVGDVDVVGAGAGPLAPSADAFNLQVDTKAKDSGLYLKFEFDARRDYDLYLRYADGNEAAGSHGWNTIVEDPGDAAGAGNSTEGYAGDSTDSSENIIGVHVTDCSGWTVEVDDWLGEGGDFTVKAWLGEIKNEPLAPGEEEPV